MEVNLQALSSASEVLSQMRRQIIATQDQLNAAKTILSDDSMPIEVTNGFSTIDEELVRLDTGLSRLSAAAEKARLQYQETEQEIAEGSENNTAIRADLAARFNRAFFRPLRPSDQQYSSIVRDRIVSVVLGKKGR